MRTLMLAAGAVAFLATAALAGAPQVTRSISAIDAAAGTMTLDNGQTYTLPVVGARYKPLTFWSKVILSTTYFTDPQRVKDLVFVYSFDPAQFINDRKLDSLDDFVNNGTVLLGFPDERSNIVAVSIRALSEKYKTKDTKEILVRATQNNGLVLSALPDLLGWSSSAALVADRSGGAAGATDKTFAPQPSPKVISPPNEEPKVASGPEIVKGPGGDARCFLPWTEETKYVKWRAKPGPYRIALATSDVVDPWHTQVVKAVKAYVAQPDVAATLKEFRIVTTGGDIAAQTDAINNLIASGYQAIVVNVKNGKALEPVLKRAQDAGVILVAFNNTLDSEDAINVDVDPKDLGATLARWLIKYVPNGGKVMEIGGGYGGRSFGADLHDGIRETLDKSGKSWNLVEEVNGQGDPTAKMIIGDLAVEHFDGITSDGGNTGSARAMVAKKDGITGNGPLFYGASPALGAIAIKTATAALDGEIVPQSIRLPLAIFDDHKLNAGGNYYSDQSDNVFVSPGFPMCGINLTAQEIMGQ